jgi:hypothetical protein
MPLMRLETSMTDSGGRTATCVTAPFREDQEIIPAPCEPNTPPDWAVLTYKLVKMYLESDPSQFTKIQEFTTSPGYQDLEKNYPQCAGTVCVLDLNKGDTSCFDLEQDCLDWQDDPQKAEKYNCTYAGAVVELAKCWRYAPTFNPQKRDSGEAYAPEPGAKPGAQTSAPPVAPTPSGTAVKDPEKSRECLPSGWGVFNPIEWIMKPVGCALETAFVPRVSAVTASLNTVQSAWRASVIGGVLTTASSWQFVPPAGGCNGITVDVFFLGPPFQVMNACPGQPLASMAFWSRIFGNVMFSIYGAVAITRHIGKIAGYGGLDS